MFIFLCITLWVWPRLMSEVHHSMPYESGLGWCQKCITECPMSLALADVRSASLNALWVWPQLMSEVHHSMPCEFGLGWCQKCITQCPICLASADVRSKVVADIILAGQKNCRGGGIELYTISKVSESIGIIKPVPVSVSEIQINDTFLNDINKHKAILTQKWTIF